MLWAGELLGGVDGGWGRCKAVLEHLEPNELNLPSPEAEFHRVMHDVIVANELQEL